MNIKDKIKGIKIDGKLVAWKIFQIPSLASNYKSFSNLREEIGIDSLTKGSFLNRADELHYNKKTLIKVYSILFPNNDLNIKIFEYLFIFRNIIKGPHSLFKKCLDDEALFCYLYSMNAIYIDKHNGGLDDNFESIVYSKSDSEIKLFKSSHRTELMPFLNNDKWGFKKGDKLVIDCVYDYVKLDGFFNDIRFGDDRLVPVCQNKLFGYIDMKGETIIDFQYLFSGGFNNGFAIVSNLKNKVGVINRNNDIIIDFKYDDIYVFNDENDLFVVKLNNKYGLINSLNKVVLEIAFEEIEDLEDDRAIVNKKIKGEGLYGCIDSKGTIIVEPIYEWTFWFINDLADVRKNHLTGVIDKLGNLVIPFEYDAINIHKLVNYNSLNTLITAKKYDKWGITYMGGTPFIPDVMNAMVKNEFTIKKEEDILKEFQDNLDNNQFEGLKSFALDGKYGFNDSEDEVIIEAIYDNCYGFENFYSRVKKNDKWGIINTKGEIMVDFIYDEIHSFDDVVFVERANKFFYLDENGNELASNL